MKSPFTARVAAMIAQGVSRETAKTAAMRGYITKAELEFLLQFIK